jgi:hypothetical protein
MAKSIQVPLREKLSLAFTLIEDTIAELGLNCAIRNSEQLAFGRLLQKPRYLL